MQAALSRVPLKIQIGSLVALAGLILAGLLAVQWIGASVSGEAAGLAKRESSFGAQATQLDMALLDGRRREKDFLLRKDGASITEHAASMRAATAALDAMDGALPSGDARHADVTAVRKGLALYGETFHALTDDQTRVGLSEKDGLMGALRGSVHEVETILKSYDELRLAVLMLMMRRHEKDFLARLDPKYIDELDQRVTEFGKAITGSAVPTDARPAIMERMTAYQRDFKAAAQGTLAVAATTKRLSDSYAAVQPQIRALVDSAGTAAAAARAEATRVDHLVNRIVTLLTVIGFAVMAVLGTIIARSIYQPLNGMTRRMAENATGMAQSAGAVGTNCQSVAAAAAQALANAQTVAAAAEQLSASIHEIAGQVGGATRVTGDAVGASERARRTITELSTTVGRIGEVAGLINDIAAQTNLLALNATVSRSIKQAQFSPWYEPISVAA